MLSIRKTTSENANVDVAFMSFICFVLVVIGIIAFSTLNEDKIKSEAITRGYASYGADDGEWHWNYTNIPLSVLSLPLKSQAVKLHFAVYNTNSGNWQWIIPQNKK